MFVSFKPKDGDAQTWDFVPEDVYEDDAELIEQHSGAVWDDFIDNLRAGQARARRVLLWYLTRQTHPKLPFNDTPRFRMGELTVEFSSSELQELIDKVEKMDASLPEDQRQLMLSRLRPELTEALLRERGEDAEPEPVGKADSPA